MIAVAGTDSSREPSQAAPQGGPAIILVRPQLGENIGMCCRAMLNNGLTDLRLVDPRDGWPNDKARAAASGADVVVDGVRIFETTADAVTDLNRVYATTARPRDSSQTVMTPREAAPSLHADARNGVRTGVLFGPEAKGLANEDVVMADAILAVPLNPAFRSLNLAQAVFCVAYEWFQGGVDMAAWHEGTSSRGAAPASKEDLVHMFEHLEQELDDCGFLRPPEKRPTMVQNIRIMFQRAQLTDQEVRTMRGIISGLTRKHLRGRR